LDANPTVLIGIEIIGAFARNLGVGIGELKVNVSYVVGHTGKLQTPSSKLQRNTKLQAPMLCLRLKP